LGRSCCFGWVGSGLVVWPFAGASSASLGSSLRPACRSARRSRAVAPSRCGGGLEWLFRCFSFLLRLCQRRFNFVKRCCSVFALRNCSGTVVFCFLPRLSLPVARPRELCFFALDRAWRSSITLCSATLFCLWCLKLLVRLASCSVFGGLRLPPPSLPGAGCGWPSGPALAFGGSAALGTWHAP